jgi:2-oxoglutarate dehydrogenase complex dehydrogenase (E1) component-like enzyme
MDTGTSFSPILSSHLDGRPYTHTHTDTHTHTPTKAIIFCSGKVYFDILKEAEKYTHTHTQDVLVVRVEELGVCVCVCLYM